MNKISFRYVAACVFRAVVVVVATNYHYDIRDRHVMCDVDGCSNKSIIS